MDLHLKNKEWKEFIIGEIFDIGTGALLPKRLLKKGNIPRITATDSNNGVFDFYTDIKHSNYRIASNFISVSFLGSIFYHPYKASLDMKIHYVKLKGLELNEYLAHFIILALKRTTFLFSYGDQLSSTDLPKKKILLPANKNGEPDYKFMEFFMKQKKEEKLKQFHEYITHRLVDLKDIINVENLENKEWREFFLKDVFTDIQRGKRLKKADHKKGSMPYVSSSGLNNGVDGFVSNMENVRIFSNCLTLANSGSVGACFYQPFKFVASDHVTQLKNDDFNAYIYMFISSILKRLSEKYSFNREINDRRIKKEKILLPVNDYYQPDYEYMKNYMKQIEHKKLKEYSSRHEN